MLLVNSRIFYYIFFKINSRYNSIFFIFSKLNLLIFININKIKCICSSN
jgi:hypothetical protein